MSTVWCLVITHDNTILGTGEAFKVSVTEKMDVADLKKNVKEEKKPDLDHVAADRLTVWRCMEPRLLADTSRTTEELRKTIQEDVNFSDTSKTAVLHFAAKVTTLKLCEDEILLVKIPGMFQFLF